jgi:glyoxylase-like metal-dependent hydrolase (beta-lactamase superfamily II)
LIGDCGATDAADSDAGMLFDSLTRRLLTLPDETLVYPAHDFFGRRVSCIGEARENNPKLTGITRDEFILRQRQGVMPAAVKASE